MWKYANHMHEAKMGELLKYVPPPGKPNYKMRAAVRRQWLRLNRYSVRAEGRAIMHHGASQFRRKGR
jgi:hypothetical protein